MASFQSEFRGAYAATTSSMRSGITGIRSVLFACLIVSFSVSPFAEASNIGLACLPVIASLLLGVLLHVE